jgi:uncharacterized protein
MIGLADISGGRAMRKWAGAALMLGMFTGQALAVPPSDAQVRQLFNMVHMNQVFSQMSTQMAEVMHQALPCVPASYWQGFLDTRSTDELMNRMLPIYQRHFTAEEFDGVLKFYSSPIGQKMLAEMPTAMAEGMQIGKQWGQQRAQQMAQELQLQGTLDAHGRCPASPSAGAAALGAGAGH